VSGASTPAADVVVQSVTCTCPELHELRSPQTQSTEVDDGAAQQGAAYVLVLQLVTAGLPAPRLSHSSHAQPVPSSRQCQLPF
jgi:hypothetical protein